MVFIEVGAHTVHHVALKDKLSFVVNNEVSQSKKDLEKYGFPAVSFAYPDGSFDQQAIDAVKIAGFKTAVSTIPGDTQSAENRYFLFRIRPGYRVGKSLLDYLSQDRFRAY